MSKKSYIPCCIKYLDLIAKIKNTKTRKAVLKDFSSKAEIFEALKEIATNTINKNVPLTSLQKKKLRHHKKIIIALSQKKNKSNKTKKKLVEQSGGFLPVLIPIIFSIVDQLL